MLNFLEEQEQFLNMLENIVVKLDRPTIDNPHTIAKSILNILNETLMNRKRTNRDIVIHVGNFRHRLKNSFNVDNNQFDITRRSSRPVYSSVIILVWAYSISTLLGDGWKSHDLMVADFRISDFRFPRR